MCPTVFSAALLPRVSVRSWIVFLLLLAAGSAAHRFRVMLERDGWAPQKASRAAMLAFLGAILFGLAFVELVNHMIAEN